MDIQQALDPILDSIEQLTRRIEALEADRDKMRRELVIQDTLLRALRRERALHAGPPELRA